jgi:hypothetical protein
VATKTTTSVCSFFDDAAALKSSFPRLSAYRQQLSVVHCRIFHNTGHFREFVHHKPHNSSCPFP